jgi:hypothetical protein
MIHAGADLLEPAREARSVGAVVASCLARPRLDVLKLVAVVSMVIDHVNTIWFSAEYFSLRAIGRLAFPLFAFVLAYNFVRHSHHRTRFIGRLFLWAAISQLFYRYAFGGELLNIFFTLGLGLCMAVMFRGETGGILGLGLAVGLLAYSKFHTSIAARLDYGIEGVLLVFVMAQLITRPSWWRGVLAVVFAASVNSSDDLATSFGFNVAAVMSLVIVAASSTWPGEWRWTRHVRLAFYVFYPAHLFVLKALAPS